MTNDSGPPPGTPPRHEAGQNRATVRIEFSDSLSGELMDVSRAGMQVAVDTSIEVETEVTVAIEHHGETIVQPRSAVVRWRRPSDDGGWFTGFLFTDSLAWEEIGELFLTGALASDHPDAAAKS
ncbi:MAG: PilZ domain-containing protein [bacterium]|nr:PilZ domain-containing protein [bacterium]